MKKIILNVSGMFCSHCERSVVNALTELGASAVKVDLNEGTVTVEFDEGSLSIDDIKSEIVDIGYEIE